MDTNQIIEIFQWSLLGIFIGLILFLIIAMLIGLKKGVFYSTFRLLFMIILIGVAMGTLDLLIDAVGSLRIDWIAKYVIVTNETGEGVAIATSTVFGTLRDILAFFLEGNGIYGSTTEVFNTALGIARMVLKYVVFIVDMILIVTLGNLFCLLLWHIGFKHFVPKAIRKIVKVRWLAALEEGVRFVLVAGMLIAPFSAIVNTVNRSWQNNKPDSSNEMVVTIGGFIDAYNNSIIGQSVFNWTIDGTSITFDASIMNSFTSVTINGVTTSLLDQLSNVAEIGTIMSGAFLEGTDLTIDTAYLLSAETLNALFSSLNSSGLVTILLPVIATIALNSDMLSQYIDSELLEISDFDWKDETANIELMLADVLYSGILSGILDEDGGVLDEFDFKKMTEVMLSDESYGYIKRALETIDKSKLLSRAIPAIISTLAITNEEVGSFLPISWIEINSIQWGSEFAIVYDTLFYLNKVDSRIVSLISFSDDSFEGDSPDEETSGLLIPSTKKAPNHGTLKDSSEEGDDDNELLLEIFSQNADAIRTILLGEFDQSGNLINCNSDGLTVVYDSSGKKIPGRRYNLFDTSLFKNLLPMITDFLSSMIGGTTDGESSFDTKAVASVLYDLSSVGPRIKNLKEEFYHVFETLLLFQEAGESLGLLDQTITLDSLDMNKVKTLRKLLIMLDNSKILSAAFKNSFKNILTSESIGDKFANLGLDVNNFNLEVPKLGKELGDLLFAFIKVEETIDDFGSITNPSEMLNKISQNYENFAFLLDAIFDSEIINPKTDFYDGDLYNNYFDILNFIFGETGSSTMPSALTFKEDVVTLEPHRHGISHKWSNSRTINGDYYRDKYGNPIFDGENGFLAGVVATLGTLNGDGDSILDVFDDPSYNIGENLSDLNEVFNISAILAAVDRSAIFSATFGDFLDANLASLNLINVDQGITFNNVENWAIEGQNFADLCQAAGKFEDLDFANVDVLSVTNTGALNQVLHALANSSIFIDKRDGSYLFNIYLYEKLQDALGDIGGENYLNDPGTDSSPTYEYLLQDFEITQSGTLFISTADQTTWINEIWIATYMNLSDAEISSGESNPSFIEGFYHSDQIGKLSFFLKTIQETKDDINASLDVSETPFDSPIGALTSGDATAQQLGRVLHAMNDVKCLRMLVYHSFDRVLKKVNLDGGDTGSFDLGNANVDYLIEETTSKSMRDDEIDTTVSLIENFEKVGLMEGDSELPLHDLAGNPKTSYYLYRALLDLNISNIFHRSGPRSGYEKTSFQNTLYFYFTSDAIMKMLYDIDSPKDIANSSLYVDGAGKVSYILENNFDYGISTDYENQIAEIGRIVEIIASLSGGYRHIDAVILDSDENASYKEGSLYFGNSVTTYEGLKDDTNTMTVDFDYVALENITSESIHEILENFNISDTLYDCVPNVIKDVISNLENSNLFDGSAAVDFSNANVYYIYTEFTGKTNPDYEMRFYRDSVAADATREDSAELEIISNLIDDINEINKPENLGSSGIDSFGSFDEARVERVCNTVEETVSDINISYILNKADQREFLEEYDTDSSLPKLTVFEQVMKKLYIDIGLAEYNYDSTRDSAYANSETKLIAGIKEMTRQDLKTTDNLIGYSNTWNDESTSLFSLMKSIAPAVGGGNISSGFTLDLNSSDFSPDTVRNLMNKLNHLDVTSDVLAKFVKTSFANLGLDAYSTYKGNDNANYYLTQRQFAEPNGIDSIVEMLDAFSNKDGGGDHVGYFTLDSSSMKDFVNDGNSTSPIIKFIYEAKIYDETLLLDDSTTVTTDTHFMYKIFADASLDEYIFGIDQDEKINVFERLIHDEMTFGDFAYEIEGQSIDTLLINSDDFSTTSSFDPNDLNSVVSIKLALYNSMMGTLGYEDEGVFVDFVPHRAYLTSEIIAGILDHVTTSEENKISGILDSERAVFKVKGDPILNEKVTSYSDYTAETYHYLNKGEARGLYGISSLYKGNTLTAYFSLTRENDDFTNLGFVNCFEYMVYEDDGNEINSRLASIIYAADLHDVFDPLWTSYPLFTPPIVDNPTISDLNLYSVDFISLGDAIADSVGLV